MRARWEIPGGATLLFDVELLATLRALLGRGAGAAVARALQSAPGPLGAQRSGEGGNELP